MPDPWRTSSPICSGLGFRYTHAKLVSRDGAFLSARFLRLTDAIRWLLGDGLAELHGKAERADITLAGQLVWTKSGPLSPQFGDGTHESDEHVHLLELLAKLGR